MTKSAKLFLTLFIFTLLLSLPLFASAAETIVLGFNMSLTGDRQASGLSTQKGVQLLVTELNNAGGIQIGNKQYAVEVVSLDNTSKLEPAVKGTLDLITQKRVLGVIGPNSSSRAIPVGGIAQSFKTPLISPASTNPKTTENRPFVFRACFIDSFQGEVMAQFSLKEFQAESAAVLFDMENAYPSGLASFFKQSFEQVKGGGSVTTASFKTDYSDLSQQIATIISSNADVIFLPQYSYQVPDILKQLRAAGWNKPVVGGAAWGAADLIDTCGEMCKGLFFSAHFTPLGAKGKAAEFVSHYKNEFNEEPDGYAALGYDAASLLTTAISKLDEINPNLFIARNDIMRELSGIKEFNGVSGTMSMQASGDPVKSAIVIKISENGKFEAHSIVNP